MAKMRHSDKIEPVIRPSQRGILKSSSL
ncbi:uncharacterized protein G2W53_018410 [Senna tora]|uniref:Uncharacterized protein n=1 Tax=Senna tora TaxID=362788 RepID=A0A834TUZ7_9FABA|nr:uncharacterized protein G2W53_018410 [Senna tora]